MNDADDQLHPTPEGGAGEQPLGTAVEVDHRVAGGCAWAAALSATGLLTLGSAVLIYVVVTGEVGGYGLTAIFGLWLCGLGVAALAPAALLWTIHRLRARSSPRRTAGALVALVGAAALLSPLVVGLLSMATPLADGISLPSVAGVTLLVLAAVRAAERSERRTALVFAAVWVLLIGTLVYRTTTDLRVEVVWLGPSGINRTPGQVGFIATRSGNFEVRFDAPFCWIGRVVATGRYEWQPDDPGSPYGEAVFVDLPLDILPLKSGDLVRVCVRDGLAGGTGAGEVGLPPSFSTLD